MTKLIVNVSTGEEIKRELNAEELAQQKADKAKELQNRQEEQAKIAARQAILDRLGLTEEEAKLLLG